MAYGVDDRTDPSVTGWARIATGLAQGLALWALTEIVEGKGGLSVNHVLLGALQAVVLFTPFVVLAGLADMRRRTLVIWTVVVAASLAGLGAHDIARRVARASADWISGEAMIFLAAGLFIAHHLVAGAEADRRPIARFATYFDLAWKHGVQLAMSAGFVGVFWIVLFLGGALFKLIGIDVVEDVIRKSWFALPATATMLAAAVQLTDVRHALIRGVRTVALTLLSWLLPVLVVLAGAFMATLPFTGLESLWQTKRAATILLSAAAVMIILINAAYQDGEPDEPTPAVLRWAARIGGLLLAPLVAVAGYAVWLRVGQYGLTPDRIIATACVIAGICYAVGYSVAAVLPGAWMKPLELTNIVTAFVVVGLILALFSPLADPARLSVNDQMARIAAGKVTPDKVDYAFLRFHGEKYGKAALEKLAKKGGDIGDRAGQALKADREFGLPPRRTAPSSNSLATSIDWPAGMSAPTTFLKDIADDSDRHPPPCEPARHCLATIMDLNADGVGEVLLANQNAIVAYAQNDKVWHFVGIYQFFSCVDHSKALREGKITTVQPKWRDLVIEGRSFRFHPYEDGCYPSRPGDPPLPVPLEPAEIAIP